MEETGEDNDSSRNSGVPSFCYVALSALPTVMGRLGVIARATVCSLFLTVFQDYSSQMEEMFKKCVDLGLCGKPTKLLAESYCLSPYCISAQSPKSNTPGKHI